MPRFLQIIIFLSLGFQLSAQNPHPYFRNYTTDDGLPSPEVHYCIQDKNGYMWFATDNGVSRFDGYEFKNFGPREGLKHNVVFYMQKDPQGKIWMATMHGHLYYIEKDSIKTFSQNTTIDSINSKPHFIGDFHIESDGTKYLAINRNGILKINSDNTFQHILPSQKETLGFVVRLKDYWLYSNQPHPDIQNVILSPIEVFSDSIYFINNPQLLRPSHRGHFWIKTLNDGQVLGFNSEILFKVQGKKIDWEININSDIQKKSFAEDHKNRLLLGLREGKGLRKYQDLKSIHNNRFQQYLDGVSITHIYQDKQGGYWMGSLENGVFYSPNLDLKIFDKSSGLPHEHIVSFDFKNDSLLYLGFRKGQINSLNLVNNHLENLYQSSNNIIYDLLYEPSNQQLWATDGIPFILERNAEEKRFNQSNQRPFQKKMTLSRDSQEIWGTSHKGFGSINLNSKNVLLQSNKIGIRQRTLCVWHDHQNRIWVGNVNGLFEFKNNLLIAPQPFHEAFKTRVEDIGELADGTLVIATKGEGLLLWKEDFFSQLTTDDGLVSNMLENIYVDEQNRIWVGTLEGLNKITLKNDDFLVENYTTIHGLPSNEITKVKSYNGQVWVATTKGLMQWKERTPSTFSKPPIFETTLVNNEPFDFSKNQSFSYDKNDLEFKFLTINYNQNGKIPYRFRLNKEEWNLTKNRSLNLIDLSPAKYHFEVQSQNEDGVWSESNLLTFRIRPAFWQTRWFTFLWVSGLLGVSWLIYRFRLQQVQKAAQVEKEMNELQRSALQAQMNPHFIFNSLNSIQNFIVKNDQANATRFLSKFAQLIRETLNATMENKITINEEVSLLENYLALEKLRFKNQFDFSIIIDDKLDRFETMLPPLLTQPFVENAILHGFAKTEKEGFIKIDFREKNKKLEITIQDNGQGIFQSQQQKKSIHEEHKSMGMSISQKRLELADALSEFEIKEIKDEYGKVQGTIVRLLLEV